ncbi:MAG: polysaccharide biosynthesis/export family protein [Pirellulaceae bacterium]
MTRILSSIFLMGCLLVCGGCSSLGLTLWPSQLPMLSKAKEFAQRSPLPSGLEHELAKQVLPEYFVEPGDRLLLEPVELDSEFQATGDQEVMVDGSVDLAHFGRIRVAGLTVEQIEAAVVDHIESVSGNRININVQLLETNGAQVYVLGAVGSPGAYDIDGNETVLDSILMAGGLTSKASPCDIILVRPTDPCDCRVVQRVCYRQITQLGDVTTNYQIQPGDRVVVGERTLCQELAFWKQASACPCCDRSKCVECRPETKDYRNRFASWFPPFPRPLRQDDQSEGEETANAEGIAPIEPDAGEAPEIQEDSQQRSSDQDIFLPPELPGN